MGINPDFNRGTAANAVRLTPKLNWLKHESHFGECGLAVGFSSVCDNRVQR